MEAANTNTEQSINEQGTPALRVWRTMTALFAPMAAPNVKPQVGEALRFISRIHPKVVRYGDMTVALLPFSGAPGIPPGLMMGQESLQLVVDVAGTIDPLPSVAQVAEILEILVDALSFSLGSAVRVGQMEVHDITPPLKIGEYRDLRIFVSPPFGSNVRTVEMQSIAGALLVTLPDVRPDIDSKTAAALRWFYKSMSTDMTHDTFIFLWIALEILCDISPISVEAPYQARCNHSIKHCPECGASTQREVRGATIRRYLEVAYGIDGSTSSALWRMRQMMHGAVDFDASSLKNLPALVQPLRSAVAAGIKRLLNIDPTAAPLVSMSGLSVSPAMGIEGSRPISSDDMRSLAELLNTGQLEEGRLEGNSSRDVAAETARES